MSNLPLDLMKLSADTIRTLSMDAVQKANSGHPGMPMGMADTAVVLWTQFLKHNPDITDWIDRDRFVLSAGHGSMLIYSLLHLTGYDLSLDEIKNFRQWGSHTPGHPEYGHTAGVETTTGPLGQGITNAVGMALAERHLAAKFNREGFEVVNHHTYVIASDGDLMEGVSHEACALAGHLGLSKLIVLYDDNSITIDGTTELSMTENVLMRYEAYGWHTQRVNGHDMTAVHSAITAARAETERPSIISCKTLIGYGSPNKQNSSKAHGSPLGEEEIVLTKQNLGWPYEEAFTIPGEALEFMRGSAEKSAEAFQTWRDLFGRYIEAHPDLATQFVQAAKGNLPDNWQQLLPSFSAGEKMATRNASGKVLAELVPHLPTLVGGSADLTGSNKTLVKSMSFLERANPAGSYINYGVREHGMAGMMNGMMLHGGVRPYAGTFLVFSDYMRPSMRLAALMNQPVIYVLTHDSIGLGEDGPTHQPIEHLMSLRAIPNLWVVRPADANETAIAWQIALERTDGPTALVLTRQGIVTFEQDVSGASKGGYVVSDSEHPQAIIMATGSEVEIALSAQAQLAEQGIATRIVSMPCIELFEQQSAEYQASVLPSHIVARVSIEAGVTLGWQKYVGQFGKSLGIDHFGASAPYQEIYEQFGLTASTIADTVKTLLS